MRKISLILAACLVMWGGAASAQEKIRLTTFEFAPYVQNDGGQAKGISVDLVNEIFSRMKQPIAIEVYPPARAIETYVKQGADGLFTVKMTPERQATMLFPKTPLIQQDFVLFARKGSKPAFAGDLAALSSKTVGVVTGLTYGDKFGAATKSGAVKTDAVVSLEQNFKKLLAERVDFVVSSRYVGMQMLQTLGATDKVEVSGPPIETLPSYLVLQRGKHEAIAEKFDQILAGMQKDGTINKIIKAHGL